jgi:hypothetical protein
LVPVTWTVSAAPLAAAVAWTVPVTSAPAAGALALFDGAVGPAGSEDFEHAAPNTTKDRRTTNLSLNIAAPLLFALPHESKTAEVSNP